MVEPNCEGEVGNKLLKKDRNIRLPAYSNGLIYKVTTLALTDATLN